MSILHVFVGIDPGKKGGVAVVDQYGDRLISREMPVTPEGGIDILELKKMLMFSRDEVISSFAVIEKSQAMPGQGVVSMFNYGVGYGRLQAVVELLGIECLYVRPGIWKKEFGLLGKTKTKQDSVDLACKLFPSFSPVTPKGRIRDGEAEALLLAEWGRRNRGE